jgi:hypothetical protein
VTVGRLSGTGGNALVTSGADSGANGRIPRRAYWTAYAVIVSLILLGVTVNAISLLQEHPTAARWKPFVLEYTSAALSIPLVGFVGFLLRKIPPRRDRRLRFMFGHLAGTLAYSLMHSAGFTILRMAIYAALRQPPYRYFNPIYEYPKDVVSYVYLLILFWGAGWMAKVWTGRQPAPRQAGPIFLIRDGSRALHTPVSEIVAACSAGNYVEFHLVDGRKHLMRATLTSIAEQLAPQGFLRTHRSWLINPLRVRALRSEGSGDFCIELDGGTEAPLSRRFPQYLQALRSLEVSA